MVGLAIGYMLPHRAPSAPTAARSAESDARDCTAIRAERDFARAQLLACTTRRRVSAPTTDAGAMAASGPEKSGMNALTDEMRRLPRPTLTPEEIDRSEWHADALSELLQQTRYRDLIFTRRRSDDQAIAYLADEWSPHADEVLAARLIRGAIVGPDGEPVAYHGFQDLAEPYGTILLRVNGQETLLRLRPPTGE
jgi:hypothetical protein